MAMLAEKKLKKKWCLNPRGNTWAHDDSKFGQRILEKMGWSKGKGLGLKEDGVKEHVNVKFKNDNKGIGFNEKVEPWTEVESSYSNILTALSQVKDAAFVAQNKTTNVASLEEKSQRSRARLHYSKFMKGKDLSRYSQKDLASIFGKKELSDEAGTSSGNIQITHVEVEDVSKKFVSAADSSVEYFNKKLANFKSETKITEDSKDCIVTKTSDSTDGAIKIKNKRKNSSKHKKVDSKLTELNIERETCNENKKKVKKRKINGHLVSASDDSVTKRTAVKGIVNEAFIDNDQRMLQSYVKLERLDFVSRRKYNENEPPRKKIKTRHLDDNESRNAVSTEECNSNKVGKTKSKKHKKQTVLQRTTQEMQVVSSSGKKLKGSKKKKGVSDDTSSGIDNPALNLSPINSLEQDSTVMSLSTPCSSRHRRNALTLEQGVDNPALDLSPQSSPEQDTTLLSTPCSSRHRRNALTLEQGIDNPALYISPMMTPIKSAMKTNSSTRNRRKSVVFNESINKKYFFNSKVKVSNLNTRYENSLSKDTDNNSSDEVVDIDTQIDRIQTEVENTLNEEKLQTAQEKEAGQVKSMKSLEFKVKALQQLEAGVIIANFPGICHEKDVKGYGRRLKNGK